MDDPLLKNISRGRMAACCMVYSIVRRTIGFPYINVGAEFVPNTRRLDPLLIDRPRSDRARGARRLNLLYEYTAVVDVRSMPRVTEDPLRAL
jgi:hypothetical protein